MFSPRRERTRLIALLAAAASLPPSPAGAFPASKAALRRGLLEKVSGGRAELLVSVGRVPGTTMPPDWAASGARLGFPLEVEFTGEEAPYDLRKEHSTTGDVLMGSTLMAIEPVGDPTFVSTEGTQAIDVGGGAYGCQVQGTENVQYSFRFFLDFPSGARRNDVELPAGRVYFLSTCWLFPGDSSLLDRASRRKEKLGREIDLTDARANKIRSQELADNVLGSLIQRAFNLRHLAVLADRRRQLRSELDDLERRYPVDPGRIVPGPDGVIFAEEGAVAVKRPGDALDLGRGSRYCWVGTFTINRFVREEPALREPVLPL